MPSAACRRPGANAALPMSGFRAALILTSGRRAVAVSGGEPLRDSLATPLLEKLMSGTLARSTPKVQAMILI